MEGWTRWWGAVPRGASRLFSRKGAEDAKEEKKFWVIETRGMGRSEIAGVLDRSGIHFAFEKRKALYRESISFPDIGLAQHVGVEGLPGIDGDDLAPAIIVDRAPLAEHLDEVAAIGGAEGS